MKKGTVISVRSNCNFGLNYEKGTLHPQAEIIIITTEPVYKMNKAGDGFSKTQNINEIRFNAGIEGVNALIGELQLVIKNMNAFDQLAGSFNGLIINQKKD